MEDRQLIELYFARSEDAIRETEAKYGKLCLTIARNVLQDEEDAAECVNDVCLGLWNAIPPQQPENLRAFLCKITRNLALKRLRFDSAAKRSAPALLPLLELEEILPAPGQQEDRQLADLLNAFLRQEKAEARNVFLRRYWFLDSVADIAARYGWSESKVKSMLHRTRGRLREYLQKEGFCL